MKLGTMHLNLDNLIYGAKAFRLMNIALGAASVGLLAWLFLIWSEPVDLAIDNGEKAAVSDKASGERSVKARSYSVIVDKDLFSPERKKYVPMKPKPVMIAVPQGPPPPPPRKAPPRLTLIGTVLLDDAEAAIMEYPGGAQKGAYYRIGDMLEEFAVKEIRKDSVVLERDDGVVLKVSMSASSAPQQMERPQIYSPRAQSEQRDIPAGLVPRPSSPWRNTGFTGQPGTVGPGTVNPSLKQER